MKREWQIMDATNPSAHPTMASRAPLRVGRYALAVRDLDRLIDFYRDSVGLAVLDRSAQGARLGTDGVVLLELEHRPVARPDDPAAAGLFHTAFLMPTRGDLAEWYLHSKRIGLNIARTGDHLVNEAIYYDDPEGNGCECYSDRPPETWIWDENGCEITTGKSVDLDALARDALGDGSGWRTPAGLRIGHINLRVGDTDAAEKFYSGTIGLDHTGRRDVNFTGRPGIITFMSSGHYHHHFAANDFTSRGARRRQADRAGLAWFAFEHDDSVDLNGLQLRLRAAGAPVVATGEGFETRDPWGTRVRFVAA